MSKINLQSKFLLFNDIWTPKILSELNDQYIKIAKIKGNFVWHSHENEDELFLVVKGTLYIEFKDKTEEINEGEIIVVPKGVEHKPFTKKNETVHIMMIEPKSTINTGNTDSDLTKENLEWL